MENENDLEPKWYVIHTLTGYENMVKDSLLKVIKKNALEDTILDVQVPMMDVVEEKNGKKKIVQRKKFPCYVLLKMKYRDSLWHTIVNTRGVTSFAGPDGRPLPLPDVEVRKMQLEKVKIDMTVRVGDQVKVTSGPLEGFVGEVAEVDNENQKCKLNVEMFGRLTPVDVDFVQIDVLQ